MKTLVLGASLKPHRFSNRTIRMLNSYGHEVVAVGLREGMVGDTFIHKGQPEIPGLHTITMYLGAKNQVGYYDYILSLNPKRIIFNPGAENPELSMLARNKGIQTENSCTLVLLNTDQYDMSSLEQ